MLNTTDLFVVLLKSSQVLTGLRELALLHSLSDIPGTKIQPSILSFFAPLFPLLLLHLRLTILLFLKINSLTSGRRHAWRT